MTHDELLAKIDNTADRLIEVIINMPRTADIMNMKQPKDILAPLRAVVELHKPIEEDGKLWCRHEACYNHIEFLERDDCFCDYPCPTIQAIEKEIGL